jgi:hydroxymethylpyrimidine/phosphomethylpyrimidine kinase
VNEAQKETPRVLTIAGFDPSGGAGTIADIRTIQEFRCVAVAAITSITFQNDTTYSGAVHQTAESVRAQVSAILAQGKIGGLKIGMLPTADLLREVVQLIQEFEMPAPVVDPVIESTSGGKLMTDEAFEIFVAQLLPLARVITPNIPEAEKLAGLNIRDEEMMRQAAARIRELGARAVLIKGGHLKQESGVRSQKPEEQKRQVFDVLDEEGEVNVLRSEWIDAPNVRGTGCMLSSAIACGLAKGYELERAIHDAKQFVAKTIQNSRFKIQD